MKKKQISDKQMNEVLWKAVEAMREELPKDDSPYEGIDGVVEAYTPKELNDESYKNHHTLDSLLAAEPTEEDIDEVLDLVTEEILHLWENFQYFLYQPQDNDTVSDIQLMFEIQPNAKNKQKLFAKTMEKGIEEDDTNPAFYQRLTEGKVLPLDGDMGIEFEKDGTGIMDLRTGDTIRVIASFTTKALREAREEEEDE